MLQIPDLDDITYEQLIQRAVHKIPLLTNEWTDFNRHDPGITTLEIYAWLTDMLNYYMNATGSVHIMKYMKLLGITPLKKQAAEAWVCVETDHASTILPEGFPIYAQNKCFVCEKTTEITDNRFVALLYENQGKVENLTAFAGEDGSYAKVFRVENKETGNLYFEFEKGLDMQTRLFITVKEYQERNELPKDFHLSALSCSFFDGENWADVEIAEDQTNGLLRSGVLALHLPATMKKCVIKEGLEGFYLRVTIKENQFDVTPELGKIFLNPVKMIQKEEFAKNISYEYTKENKYYEIPCYVSGQDKIAVGVKHEKKEDTFCLVHGFESSKEDICFVDMEKKCIKFTNEMEPAEGSEVDVFLSKEDFITEMEIGITDGCAGQELPFFINDPYELQLILMREENGKTLYQHWKYLPSLEQASYEDKVFTYNQENNSIQFGDGIHGMVPQTGDVVYISECSLSDYEQGNVLQGEIRIIKDENYANLRAFNTAMATGGREADSIPKMQQRFEQKLLEQNRVVSPGDYEKLIKDIPGLMIRGAKVISAREYCKYHMTTYKPYDIYVVVCPYSMKPKDKLNSKYHDYICNYLEQYRMINTNVKVVAPVYGCINMSGRIRIIGNETAAKKEIEVFLQNYLQEKQEACCFGATISYGDIFMQIELLDSVERVEELHLSLGGTAGKKSEKGDIVLNSDCLPYLGDLDFEYKE